MADGTNQLALTGGGGAQGSVNNGQQQQGGAANAQSWVTPGAEGGLALLAQASQFAEQNGQVGSPTPTIAGGGRNLFGATPTTMQPVKARGAVLQAIEQSINILSEEEMKKELLWQKSKGEDKKLDFKNELLASYSPNIRVCAFVQKDSAVVKVVHGLSTYYGEAAREYCNKVIGRTGEWTDEMQPIPLVMPEKKAWEWGEDTVCTDAVAWKNHITANPDSVKPWNPPAGGTTTKIALPRMIYVPAIVAKFLVVKERSAFELYTFLGELIREDNAYIKLEHVEFLQTWAMAAGQYAIGTTSHQVAISVSPVMNVSQNFTSWLLRQMRSYLESPTGMGTPHGQQQSPPQQQQHVHQGQSADVLVRSMTQVLERITEKQSANAVEAEKKAAAGKALTPHQMAALLGFCGLEDPNEIPELYKIMMQCTRKEDVRNEIMRLLDKWAYDKRRQIDQGVYLTDEIVTAIMNVTPNPTGTVATSVPSDKILSNLVVLPRRVEQIEQMMLNDRLVEETKGNRTLKDAEKLSKSDVRAPPSTYDRLKLNITTTQGLITVCYGERCPMAIGLQALFNQLNTREAHYLGYKYTALVCGKICWAIFDAMRSFFATSLLPQDFEKPHVSFPMCSLADIVADVKFQREVYRSTFPVSWEKRMSAMDSKFENTEQGEGVKNERKTTAIKRTAFQEYFTPGSLDQPAAGGALKQIHPKFQKALKKYHELNGGSINIGQIMDLAKITWKDLPCLKGHWNTKSRKCLTCWPHMLGECVFGDRCHFAKQHVLGKDIEDNYADEVLRLIMPGVEAMVEGKISVQKGKKPRV